MVFTISSNPVQFTHTTSLNARPNCYLKASVPVSNLSFSFFRHEYIRFSVKSRLNKRMVCAAASAAGSSSSSDDSNPYEVLGVNPIEGFDMVKAAYARRRKDAERRGDEATLAQLEKAYDKIMMSQLTKRKQGVTFGSFKVSKEVRYADKQPILPWGPRFTKSDDKDIKINLAISAVFIAWVFINRNAEWKPLQFLAFAFVYRIFEKLKAFEPPTPTFTEEGEDEGRMMRMGKMETHYSSYLFYLAIFSFFTPILFRYFFHRKRNLPPSPFSFPIIGHLYLVKNALHLTLTSLSAKYGPVLYLKLGYNMPVIVVSSPSAVEECLTRNDVIFANRPKTLAGDKFTYNYIVYVWAPYGQLWRILRRLTVVELFSSQSLSKSCTLRDEEITTFIRCLYRFSTINSSKKVDLTNWAFTLVFNLMTKIIAGKHIVKEEDAGMEKGIEIIEKLRGTFLVTISFLNMIDFLPILRWFGYKGLEKKMDVIHSKRNEFLNTLLDEFRRNKISGLKSNSSNTLIETLLSFQESEPEFYTDDIIKSIMLVVFVAGTETSSSTIQWVMRLLLAHPEVLHKLRADIDNKVGNKRLVRESDLTKLPYLRCVVNETMRLYPPVPLLLPHYSTEDCTVGGYDVPKHTMLLINAWAVHRDPKVWDDPEKFKPERFEATQGETERFNYKLIPFGMGRRACPGTDMGLRAVSLALGALIQCFEWQIEEEESLEASYHARMSMQNKPLKAICTPRKDLVDLLSQL